MTDRRSKTPGLFGCYVLGALAALAALSIAVPASAFAQAAGNLELDTFRPAMDSRGYITVNASSVLGDKDLSFGLGSLDYGRHLLHLGDPSTCSASSGAASYSINNIVTATLVGAVGLHVGPAELDAFITGDAPHVQSNEIGNTIGVFEIEAHQIAGTVDFAVVIMGDSSSHVRGEVFEPDERVLVVQVDGFRGHLPLGLGLKTGCYRQDAREQGETE